MRSGRISRPPLACGLALMRRSPCGRQGGDFLDRPAVCVEQFVRPVAAHPMRPAAAQVLGLGSHGDRHLVRAPEVPRSSVRPRSSGRSSPSGSAARSSASAAARGIALGARAACWMPRISIERACPARGHSLMHRLRLVAFDSIGLVAVAGIRSVQVPLPGCAPAPWDWRSCSRSDAGSAAPRRRSPD